MVSHYFLTNEACSIKSVSTSSSCEMRISMSSTTISQGMFQSGRFYLYHSTLSSNAHVADEHENLVLNESLSILITSRWEGFMNSGQQAPCLSFTATARRTASEILSRHYSVHEALCLPRLALINKKSLREKISSCVGACTGTKPNKMV